MLGHATFYVDLKLMHYAWAGWFVNIVCVVLLMSCAL